MKKEEIIYNSILENSEKNKIINLEELEQLCIEIGEEFVKKGFLRSIKYEAANREQLDAVMSYNFLGRYITFYQTTLQENVKDLWESYIRLKSKERSYLINSILVLYLYHELEHAKQNMKSYQEDEELETFLLKNTLPTTNINTFSPKLYQLNPYERLARIESSKKMYQILNQYLKEKKRVVKIFQTDLKKNKISGYHYGMSPTFLYFKKINQESIIERLKIYQKEMNLETRIYYGFPLLRK